MQLDKTVPMESGCLPNREKGNTGRGLSEFSREEVLTESLWLLTLADRVLCSSFLSHFLLGSQFLFLGERAICLVTGAFPGLKLSFKVLFPQIIVILPARLGLSVLTRVLAFSGPSRPYFRH